MCAHQTILLTPSPKHSFPPATKANSSPLFACQATIRGSPLPKKPAISCSSTRLPFETRAHPRVTNSRSALHLQGHSIVYIETKPRLEEAIPFAAPDSIRDVGINFHQAQIKLCTPQAPIIVAVDSSSSLDEQIHRPTIHQLACAFCRGHQLDQEDTGFRNQRSSLAYLSRISSN